MLRLLLSHSRAACSSTALTLRLSAPSAASLTLHSSLLSSAATAASSRPASVLLSASPLSPSLLRFSHSFSLLTAAGIGGVRSLHSSRAGRGEDGSHSSNATNMGNRSSRDLSGAPSKDSQQELHHSRNNGANKGREARSSPTPVASEDVSKPARSAPLRPSFADSTSNGRPRDQSAAGRRSRDNKSPREHAARVTEIRPFSFDAESGQSEELQWTFYQLRVLAHEHMDKFSTHNLAIARGMADITQKTEWQSMRAQARELLLSLLELSSSAESAEGRLTTFQCQLLLHACKNFRLVQSPLPVLTAMLANPERIPAKCISMLLECVVKSPTWAAQSGETAPTGAHPALLGLFTGRPSPSADLRGVELALWMLEGMTTPTLQRRFDVDASSWNIVLRGLTQTAHSDPHGLQRARAFYERIPNKDKVTHGTMLTAYQRAGMHSEYDALRQLLKADPVAGETPEVTAARLAAIHEELSALQGQTDPAAKQQQSALLQEAFELWKEKPTERLSAVVTGSLLKVFALFGDIPLMLAVIREAVAAEQALPLVFVDSACYGQLFHSMAKSDDPAHWKAEAKAAWSQMQQRHAAGAQSKFIKRFNRLRVDEATWNSYNRYLQRANQREEMDRVWRGAPRELKEGNPQIFLARLNALAEHGDLAAAERIMSEMPRFRVQPDVFHFNAWIGCHVNSGRWAEAEAVWQRMLSSSIKPNNVSYRELMQVYMRDGSPAQLDKIERLRAEVQSTALRFDATDYQHLIRCAYACRLALEARKWSERAKVAGV